ncbi:formylglycine-generating enzyme family protein [Puia sp. P3]|uniref:formylglycine-generating enzyme family protein n=1 Tax=Puia sp. P3 TaxID=3423952 RepID=UPI003D67802B
MQRPTTTIIRHRWDHFAPNGYGLYDIAGNVWEWCSDFYNNNYYSVSDGLTNPKGPVKSYDPDEPYATKRVIRGGSFLCNDSYCSGYRVSRRMKVPKTPAWSTWASAVYHIAESL